MSLTERIRRAREPLADSTEKPPFSMAQLIAMTLHTGVAMTKKEILRKILQQSGYFMDLMLQYPYAASKLQSDFEEILKTYELLLEDSGENTLSMTTDMATTFLNTVLPRSIDTDESDVCSSEAITPGIIGEANEASMFWRLPIELRIRIHGFIFQYPKSGLQHEDRKQKLSVVLRDLNHPLNFEEWQQGRLNGTLLHMAPPSTILTPLLVNKQIYKEMLTVFYEQNPLCFKDADDLSDFLRRIPDSHLKHVRSMAIDYGVGYCDCYLFFEDKSVVEILAELQKKKKLNLRNLTMRMDKKVWVDHRLHEDTCTMAVTKIPGVDSLAQMRGLTQVRVIGDPEVEAYLKARMLQKRPESGDGDGDDSEVLRPG
jgi:hypothetical protein